MKNVMIFNFSNVKNIKVDPNGQLYFVYANIIDEKELLEQMNPALIMQDPVLQGQLPLKSLLLGGSERVYTYYIFFTFTS